VRVCASELRQVGPGFGAASEHARGLDARCEALLGERARGKSPLMLTRCLQGVLGETVIQLLLCPRERGTSSGKESTACRVADRATDVGYARAIAIA
jgi:hypothetical protein